MNSLYPQYDLYLIREPESGRFKIGSSDNPMRRLRDFQTGSPFELRLEHVWRRAGFLEGTFHYLFADYSVKGEWYAADSLPAQVVELWKQSDLTDAGSALAAFGLAVFRAEIESDATNEAWERERPGLEKTHPGTLMSLRESYEERRDEYDKRVTLIRAALGGHFRG